MIALNFSLLKFCCHTLPTVITFLACSAIARYTLMVQVLSVCGDCFELSGPANTTVAFFDYGANTTSTYQLQLMWDPAYLGPLILDLVPPLR